MDCKSLYLSEEDFKRAEINGISEQLLKQRVYIYGWDKELAINRKNERLCKKYTEEQLKIAESNGISRNTLRARLNSGWDMETATTKKPNKYRKDEGA